MGQLTQMWVGGVRWSQTFINHCFYGIFDPFLPKISEKFTEKVPTFGERGGVKPVGPNSQLLPKISFEGSPHFQCQTGLEGAGSVSYQSCKKGIIRSDCYKMIWVEILKPEKYEI